MTVTENLPLFCFGGSSLSITVLINEKFILLIVFAIRFPRIRFATPYYNSYKLKRDGLNRLFY